jgi:hypothetical protein
LLHYEIFLVIQVNWLYILEICENVYILSLYTPLGLEFPKIRNTLFLSARKWFVEMPRRRDSKRIKSTSTNWSGQWSTYLLTKLLIHGPDFQTDEGARKELVWYKQNIFASLTKNSFVFAFTHSFQNQWGLDLVNVREWGFLQYSETGILKSNCENTIPKKRSDSYYTFRHCHVAVPSPAHNLPFVLYVRSPFRRLSIRIIPFLLAREYFYNSALAKIQTDTIIKRP